MSAWRLGAVVLGVVLSLVNGLAVVHGPLDVLGGVLVALAILLPQGARRRRPGNARAAVLVSERACSRRPPRTSSTTPSGPISSCAGCSAAQKEALQETIGLAVEIAREGREGRKIGTLFVVGDTDEVLARSRPLILDPLAGHAPELLDVRRPDFRETVKELAQLDGAFVVDSDGTFVSAGRFVEVDVHATDFIPGLGTRHAAAASITRMTRAFAVVVSQSSIVRVFAGGELRAEVLPELFLLARERAFRGASEVRQMPEYGLTLALAGDGAAPAA